MKIGYLQKGEATAAWIGSDPGMVGIARKRPDDRWSPVVGLAVALLKAEFGGPTGQDRDAFMLVPFTDDIKRLELSDAQVLVWADLRHGLRLGIKSVDQRREEMLGVGFSNYPPDRIQSIKNSIIGINPSVPSDGQLCENFALRFISEADLQIE